MYLKLKLAALASTLVIAGAAKTTDEVVVAKTEQEATTDVAAADADAADTTNRELYGSKVIDRRVTTCPQNLWCESYESCMNSDAAKAFGVNGNGMVTDNNECIGGCARKTTDGGRVSWFEPAAFDVFRSCAPQSLERVCCAPENPTASPTWMDDSWGKADTWSGGNNKKGWGGWEP